LSSASFRKKIINNLEAFKELNPDKVEVYVEVAVLRDYWNDLGDPIKYETTTAQNRMKILQKILTLYEIEDCLSNPAFSFFWTSKTRKKLWNPGRWEISTDEKKLLIEKKLKKLYRIKWAFNAKPDILLVSDKVAIIIEAKVESGEGINQETGYKQLIIQRDYIARIMKNLIPDFKDKEVKHIYLTKNENIKEKDYCNMHWGKIKEIMQNSEVDKFTKDCFQKFV
jgi:hypothetical protein